MGRFIIPSVRAGDKTKKNRSEKCFKATPKNVVDINHPMPHRMSEV